VDPMTVVSREADAASKRKSLSTLALAPTISPYDARLSMFQRSVRILKDANPAIFIQERETERNGKRYRRLGLCRLLTRDE